MYKIINNELSSYDYEGGLKNLLSMLPLPQPPYHFLSYYFHRHKRTVLLSEALAQMDTPEEVKDNVNANVNINVKVNEEAKIEDKHKEITWIQRATVLIGDENYGKELAEQAIEEALYLGLETYVEDMIQHLHPDIEPNAIQLLLEKENYSLIKMIFSLGLNLKERKMKVMMLMSQIGIVKKPDNENKLTIGKVAQLGFDKEIHIQKIMKAIKECQDLNQTDAICVLLKNKKFKEAMKLLEMKYPVNDECFLFAVREKAWKVALNYIYGKKFNLESFSNEIIKQLIETIQKDHSSNEISLFFIRKLIDKALYNEAKVLVEYLFELITKKERLVEYIKTFVNPIKIVVLILELLSLFASIHSSCLKPKCDFLYEYLSDLFRKLQEDFDSEEQAEMILLEKDIEGRSVISIIISLNGLNLLSKNHLNFIANSIWNGGYIVNNTGCITSTSSLWKLLEMSIDPNIDQEQRFRQNKLVKENSVSNIGHPFQFEIWKSGIAFRFIMHFGEYLASFCMFFICALASRTYVTNAITIYKEGANNMTALNAFNDNAYLGLQFASAMIIIEVLIIISMPRYFFRFLFFVMEKRKFSIFDGDFAISFLLLVDLLVEAIQYMPVIGPQSVSWPESTQNSTALMNYLKSDSMLWLGLTLTFISLRFLFYLKLTSFMGPFIKMLTDMAKSISIFSIFFILLLLIFGFVGFLIIPYQDGDALYYDSFLVRLFQTSLGTFDLVNGNYATKTIIFYIVFIVIFSFILLNLIIAILNTIHDDSKETGELGYLEEVIVLRDLFKPSKTLQFLTWSCGPCDVATSLIGLMVYPFLNNPQRVKFNTFLLHFQYGISLLLIIPFYCAVEFIFLPFAYIKVLCMKFCYLIEGNARLSKRIWTFLFFFIFGLIQLILYIFSDIFYFIIGCYATNLQKIVDRDKNYKISKKSFLAVFEVIQSNKNDVDTDTLISDIERCFNIHGTLLLTQINREQNINTPRINPVLAEKQIIQFEVFSRLAKMYSYINTEGKKLTAKSALIKLLESFFVQLNCRYYAKKLSKKGNYKITENKEEESKVYPEKSLDRLPEITDTITMPKEKNQKLFSIHQLSHFNSKDCENALISEEDTTAKEHREALLKIKGLLGNLKQYVQSQLSEKQKTYPEEKFVELPK